MKGERGDLVSSVQGGGFNIEDVVASVFALLGWDLGNWPLMD